MFQEIVAIQPRWRLDPVSKDAQGFLYHHTLRKNNSVFRSMGVRESPRNRCLISWGQKLAVRLVQTNWISCRECELFFVYSLLSSIVAFWCEYYNKSATLRSRARPHFRNNVKFSLPTPHPSPHPFSSTKLCLPSSGGRFAKKESFFLS